MHYLSTRFTVPMTLYAKFLLHKVKEYLKL